MKVSIVFTTYQSSKISEVSFSLNYLVDELNKCLPIEFILVMNGSSDERLTSKLLDYKKLIDTKLRSEIFNDTQLHTIYIPVDIVEARRQGVELASGDWIIYIDSGQNIAPNRLEVLDVYATHFYPKASILFSAYTVEERSNLEGFSADYFPSIWRDREFEATSKGIAISNFIGIAHKRSLGLIYNSELEFCKQMIVNNIQWGYCDIVAGRSPEDRLTAGNYDYTV